MTNHLGDDNNEEKEESFAALLEAYGPGMDADVSVGDKIRGKIISIGKDSVFVDTGTKIDGDIHPGYRATHRGHAGHRRCSGQASWSPV